MLVLGISDNHDSGAALVRDGVPVAAVGQERLDRVKNSAAFPWLAIREVLALGGVAPAEVDVVALGTAWTPSTLLRLAPGFHAEKRGEGNFSYLLNLYIAYQVALRRTGLHHLERVASETLVGRRLRRAGFTRATIQSCDHHGAHAEAAWRSQPRRRCLVVTMDAMGDGATATVWRGGDAGLDPVWEQSGLAGVNTFYSRITEFLGFRANRHEGKITGLAAYGTPPEALLAHLRRLLRFDAPGFNRLNYLLPQAVDDRFYRVLARYTREEVAAAAQRILEEAVTAFVRHHVRTTGLGDVAVAGGTFANVALNRRIAELPEVSSLFVYPNMGDGGLPVGAALRAAGAAPRRLDHLYLGPTITEDAAAEALRAAGLEARQPPDLAERVADLLARGRVVARCDGPMEWGPRALGNRSILYRADEPSVNDWLNKRLRRTEFMPFAPMTLAEDAPALYLGLEKAADAARFMTICFPCTERMRQEAPGVVHVDGTARPQVLHREDNPAMYDLLAAYRRKTGVGTVVNTSFNIHEEPIVCTAADALRAWADADLDALVLGPFLVERPPRT